MAGRNSTLAGLGVRADLASAFSGRSVLVTGHTGFKGSWLSIWLHALGANVHGYALEPPTEPSHFAACGTATLLTSDTRADVRDVAQIDATLEATDPDVVLHLAAQSLVRESYVTPAETFEVNVQGTVNLLDAIRRRGRPCAVVVVTSDKCYENREHARDYGETDALGGHDPYSASKGAAEIVTSSYRRSFFDPTQLDRHGVRLASARAGNVIGGGDWALDRLVPDVLMALAEGRDAPIRNPGSIRPWQHVLEPLHGYLTLAARLVAGSADACDAWNFGPDPSSDATVGELASLLVEAWGSGRCEFPEDPQAPHEAGILRLDIDKAAEHLGWGPRWDLATAVRHTVAWARAAADGAGDDDLLARTRADVAAYEAAGAGGEG